MPHTPSAVYDYCDEAGRVLFQVRRFDSPNGKRFFQGRPDGDRWIVNVAGIRKPVYRLPELLRSPSATVYFVEGEKCADFLMECGLVTTSLPGGCNSPWRPEYSDTLRGRKVVLLPDNDEPGRRFMERVAKQLVGVASVVKWLDLPGLPDKGDVVNWVGVRGTVGDLVALADDCPPLAAHDSDILPLAGIQPQPVRWLWKPWLPVGKLCLIDGDPGQGKSFVTLDLAARLSRGDAFPDGQRQHDGPLTTLLISCEDGVEDTVVPRLDAMNADRNFIVSYRGKLKNGKPLAIPQLPEDMPALENAIQQSGARLVIIDPLMAFLGASVNTVSDQSVRTVLTPLAVLAERLAITILLVRHLNKTNGKQAVYRGGGSIGIIAAMRTGMLIARHPHDRDTRVLAMVKCNLGPEPKSLGFRLAPSERTGDGTTVVWTGPVELFANDLVGDTKEAVNPKEWLIEAIGDEPRLAREILDEAKLAGYSEPTINRAKAALGIVAKPRVAANGSRAWWWLPVGMTNFPQKNILPPLEDLEPVEAARPKRKRRKELSPDQVGPYGEGW